jgi:hypothetical protein
MKTSAKSGTFAELQERIAHRRTPRRFVDRRGSGRARGLLALILLLAAFSSPSFAFQLSAAEILSKVSETYRTLRSCQFVAEESDELAAVGESRSPAGTAFSNFHKSKETRVELAAVVPAKVRLAVTGGKLDIVLVSDGERTWAHDRKQKKYSEALWNPSQAPDASRLDEQAEERILALYWKLLVGRFRGASQLISGAKLEKDSRVKVGGDQVDCYVVKAQTADASYEILVDKERFVVLRSKQTPLPPQEGIALQTAVTVTMTEASVNTALEDSLFRFAAPPNAAIVPSLDTSKW